MGITAQLYQLQELDLEIESDERSLALKLGQLGDRRELDDAQDRLAAEQEQLDGQRRKRHDAEWEIDDLSNKISVIEEQLYSGRISNPKELSSLQHESNTLKTRRDEFETRAIEIIEEVDAVENSMAEATARFSDMEDNWRRLQQQLSEDIEKLKDNLADLNQKRQRMAEAIDPQAVDLYERIRQNKKPAVARVEQGICRVCRISLSAAELQRVRAGNPIQCGSCGRILFLP